MQVTDLPDNGATELVFQGLWHTQMNSFVDYEIEFKIKNVNVDAVRICSGQCKCRASKELGDSAHCNHVLAALIELTAVTQSGKIPEWVFCPNSVEQS
jgi:hypothetical protein